MIFPKPLIPGTLIRRYKRFLADVKLNDGSVVTAHCTNSGSMLSCIEEGASVLLTHHNDPNRKTQYTWEMIFINNNWIGINTMVPNKLVYNWMVENSIPDLSGYYVVKKEVKYGDSRFDVYAENEKEKCFVEVKNVTLKVGEHALFPDAVTTRGQKHLKTLIKVKEDGYRAVMVYVIQRIDVNAFGPATEIDAVYSKLLYEAIRSGVEVLPVQVKVSPEKIEFFKKLPLL